MNDSTSDTIKVDTARLPLLLRELRLPTIAAMWQDFTERADREGWPAARLLATLTELDLAEVIGAKVLAEPHFSLAPARLGAIPYGCAAAIQPLRSEPSRA
jgi:hypothetical protein